MRNLFLAKFIIVCLLFLPTVSYAGHIPQEPEPAPKLFDTFTFYWENDAFAGTDRDYSNGMKFTWSTPYDIAGADDHLPDWSYPLFKRLPFVSVCPLMRIFV